MKKAITKTIGWILILTLSLCNLASCGVIDAILEENTDEYTVLAIFEELQENDVMPFTLTEKAKEMLSEHEDFFLENANNGLDNYTDWSLEYKILSKNIDRHGDKLIYLEEAYVISIDETDFDNETTASELHLLDANDNSYYCISLCAYDDIFEDDVVSVYALPIGETSFENISGGTTLAIMLAGCYIEKVA